MRLLALVLVLLAAPAAAQWTQPGTPPPTGGRARGIKLLAATPFSWVDGPHSLGAVGIPVGPGGGWVVVPGAGFQFRLVPGWSSDPVAEVILWPPFSGVVGKPERFLLQFPLKDKAAQPDKALIIAFHQFGVSEKNVFNATTLPFLCADRGWILLAPFGLNDTNYGTVDSQTALRTILAFIEPFVVYNQERVYTVGFSMGGLNAVSFAMRHQDPDGIRIAGVINHTGTMDVVQAYTTGTPELKALLANADHFGGTPAQVPYAYDRISPYRLLGIAVNPDEARVANLLHIPFYLHANVGDIMEPGLVLQNFALRDYLVSKGATVQSEYSDHGAQHAWGTMNMLQAIDYVTQFTLPPDPDSLDEFADRPEEFLYTEVRALPAQKVARYEVSVDASSNALSVLDSANLDVLAVDLAAVGLDPGQTLFLGTASSDLTGDTIVLEGYAQPPSQVLVFGIFPPSSWSHDPVTDELTITPNTTGAFAQVWVLP